MNTRSLVALCCLASCIGLAACVVPDSARSTISGAALSPPERQIVVTVRNGSSRAAQDIGSSGKSYGALGRYQVSPAALRDAEAVAKRHRLRQLAAWPIEVLGVHCVVFSIDDDRRIDAVLAAVASDRVVESVQLMHRFTSQGTATYDDPYLDLQDSIASMQVLEAHRWSRGRGVRIAVIDSGVDTAHPDLARRIAVRRDLTLLTGPAYGESHGTAVAGIIAAGAGNGVGIVGVAPEAQLLALRACWQREGAPTSVCDTLSLAQALAAALAERTDIINLSLSGPRDPLLERLLKRALAMGKVVVAAVPEAAAEGAGFPASLPGLLAVATTETVGVTAEVPGVLYAPGRRVLTLRPGGRYDFENGSSMAAAHVSGVAALLLAHSPTMRVADIRRLLGDASLRPIVTDGPPQPVINACRALASLAAVDAPEATRSCTAPVRRMHATRQ
jgi:hypothetical protein